MYLDKTEYKDNLYLLKHLKLKIKIPDSMIDVDTLIIDEVTSIIGRFISDGIEIENHPSLKFATVTGYLNETKYENTLNLLRYLKLKIMIDSNDLIFYGVTSIVGRFVSDGIEIENLPSFKF